MAEKIFEPSQADMLAALVKGTGDHGYYSASVQRSHRFPVHIFNQIENIALTCKAPASLIINKLLECGLEAVKEKLPEPVWQKISVFTKEQAERPTVNWGAEVKRHKVVGKPKLKRQK